MIFLKNKIVRNVKLLFVLLMITTNLYGCNSLISTKTMQSFEYTLPPDTPVEDCHYGETRINSPLVTNKIPDNNMYPFFYDNYSQTFLMINKKGYFVDNGNLYESTPSDSQEDWDTVSLELGNITEMLSDGTYLYCLTKDNSGIIYNPESHTIKCEVSLSNFFNAQNGQFQLNCVGNQKGYFSFFNTINPEEAHTIFSLDQDGKIEIINTSDDSKFIKAVYSDSEYFVYDSYPPDQAGGFDVYVKNLATNETYSIYNKKTVNVGVVCAPFYRWNNYFVFLDYSRGVCVANIDGSGVKLYHGDASRGYAMYQNKIYFSGSKLFSLDLNTGEQKTYRFSDEDNFLGSLNIYDGYIFLSRKEANSQNTTIHAITLP